MINIKPNFTVVNSGTKSAIDILKSRFSKSSHDIKEGEWETIKTIKVVEGELKDKKDCELDKENLVLRVTKENIDVIEAIRKDLKTDDYIPGESLQNENTRSKNEDPLTLKEDKSQASLGILSEILDRAYNRRTTLTGWILYFVSTSYGLKNDDFGPVSRILKDSSFAKVFTEYKKLAEENQTEADNYLKSVKFDKKENDLSSEAKQKLVKTASFLLDKYNNLNLDFVKNFPKVFCIQNIAMPFLKWAFPKVKLFDFMVCINPWIYDLVSENLGNYVGEIKGLQAVEQEVNKERVISEINLTTLSREEFSLQNIMKKINSMVERVFGKDSTVSAMIVKDLLKRYKGMEYKVFAEQFTEDTKEEGFIKELYKGLCKNAEAPEGIFDQGKEKGSDKYWVAKIISRITRVATSVTPKCIKESSNTFGAIFAPLNLAMPLLAKVFHKGFLGFMTHAALKVFPIANELLFDHLANFRKEILDIQEGTSDESMAKLFKPIQIKSKSEAFTTSVKYLWDSIKGFAGRKKPVTS